MTAHRPLFFVLALAASACGVEDPAGSPVEQQDGEQTETGDPGVEATLLPLEGARLLRRISLDLRGQLPSVAEMDRVAAEPEELAAVRAEFFTDPRFEEQLVHLLSEHWLTVPDKYYVFYYEYNLDPTLDYAWKRSIGQEPLRLMARLIVEDRHLADAVTADFTMATEITAALWPVEGYPEGGTGWHPVTWTDGRPAAGVLATNGMWWRYTSDDYNKNRSRVAAITKLLTCEDLLSRDVTFENAAALLEADEVSDMVQSESSCLACHSTIEPMAAALFGFNWTTDYGVQEMQRYHAEREVEGEDALQVEMAYWGQPINGLEDLGRAVSTDSRYYRCAAESFTQTLLRRPLSMDDRDAVDAALRALYDGQGRVWPMIEAITELEDYQAGRLSEGAIDEVLEHAILARPLSPAQLAGSLEGLTGFRWVYEGYDQLDNDNWGFRTQLGGVDGFAITLPNQEPTLGSTIAVKRIAEAAAAHEVAANLARGGDSLLGSVDLDARPGQAAFDDTLAEIWYRLTALEADADTMAAYGALWSQLNDAEGVEAAWRGTLTALLRDPYFVTY